MSDQDQDQERPHQASQQKLDRARQQGQIPKSTDLTQAAAYAGFWLVFAGMGAASVARVAPTLNSFWTAPEGWHLPAAVLPDVQWAIAPFFAGPALAVMLVLSVQRGLTFSPEKLVPKFSRVSPMANAAQKFGPKGWGEFFKSTVKLIAVSLLLAGYVWAKRDIIIGSPVIEARQGVFLMTQLLLGFIALVCLYSLPVGLIDWMWQRHLHQKDQRMTDQEVRQEHKDNEGDPHQRQARRQRGREIAMNQMMQDVPKADVIVVNPTHVAVALKWSRKRGAAPVCVAKGHDAVALRIRAVAQENGVPIHHDPPTARAVDAGVKIGDQIPIDLYAAVAGSIRFADAMRRRARAQGR